MSLQLQVDSENQPTSSFQNYPQSQRKTRKRGAAAILPDCGNSLPEEPLEKRASAVKATEQIVAQTAPDCGPRGDSRKAAMSKWASHEASTPSLCNIVRKYPDLYRHGMACISGYITRNATSEIQRAVAINVFCSIQSKWGKRIMESSEIAAELLGHSPQTIHRWVNSFFTSLASWIEPIENYDDEQIQQELSTQKVSHQEVTKASSMTRNSN